MKKVLLLLANGFEIYEASAFIDVIGWNLTGGNKQTSLFTCGIHQVLRSTFNQRLIVDYTIDEIIVDEFDALAIPGGFEEYGFYKDAYSEKFSALIKLFHEKGKIIASICTGAFPIAKCGILKDKKGTTYNLNPVRQETLKTMGVNVLNQPIVVDDNIITSWNPSTALNVAFLLLEMLTDADNANLIKNKMGFE